MLALAHKPHFPVAIVGLGNPGKKYEPTRHNIGFRVIDKLLHDTPETANRKPVNRWSAEAVETEFGWLLKPMTFMNASGESVADMAEQTGIAPERILVIVDDIHLPLGRMRLRFGGSCGGHNGLASVEQQLASNNYPRLKLGIGAAGENELIDHVLGAFDAEEECVVKEVVEQAASAVRLWINTPEPAILQEINGWIAPTLAETMAAQAQKAADERENKTSGTDPEEKEAGAEP